jgi:hypothetical protein
MLSTQPYHKKSSRTRLLTPCFLASYLARKLLLITVEWRGYFPLKKDNPNLSQIESENGKELSRCAYSYSESQRLITENSSPLQQ